MKQIIRFCLNCIIFAVIIIAISYLCNIVIIDKCKHNLPFFGGKEIYNAIKKSKQKTTHKKLLIGDSVANQFFDSKLNDSTFYSLTCNQAIGVCGHFFLLNNYLNAGNRPDEVYMIYHPSSFKNNLNQRFTYHYFLKPFYKKEYKPLMSNNIINQIRTIPFYQYCQFPLIIGTAWAPTIHPSTEDKSLLSPISAEYLEKIDSLKTQYRFKLYILPPPVAQSQKKEVENYEKELLNNSTYQTILRNYLSSIIYLPDTCFIDSIHLTTPQRYKDILLKKMEDFKRK